MFGTGNVAVRSLSGVFMVGAAVAMWFVGAAVRGRGRRVDRGGADGREPVRDPVRDRNADVLARDPARRRAGILAFQRALERPTVGRLARCRACSSRCFSTRSTGRFYLLVVVVRAARRARVARRAPRTRRAAMLVAMAIGGLAFLPWLPTFLYQRAHTGTPWGTPLLPGDPVRVHAARLRRWRERHRRRRRAGSLFIILIALLLLGVFGRAIDERRIEIDLCTPPRCARDRVRRWRGARSSRSRSTISRAVRSSRATARSCSRSSSCSSPAASPRLRDPRVLGGVLARQRSRSASSAACATSPRNARRRREVAARVARRGQARRPRRLLPRPDRRRRCTGSVRRASTRSSIPSFAGPELVDWVDYKKRLAAADLDRVRPRSRSHAPARTRSGT